jgi:hypothetical protein
MSTPKQIPLDGQPEPSRGLGRREALQILAGAMGTGIGVPGLAEGHPLHSHLADQASAAQAEAKAATGKPEFLDAHQLSTLKALAERIVPGASKARTAEFIDQLLAVDTHANQRNFLSALGAFDGRALARARRPWVALTDADQNEILEEASTMASGVPEAEPWARGKPIGATSAPAGAPRVTLRDHFDLIKGWVAGSYYSSEIGMRELGWTGNPFHLEFTGCPHPGGHP